MISFGLVQDELTDKMIICVIRNEPIEQRDDLKQRAGTELHAELRISRGLTDVPVGLVV